MANCDSNHEEIMNNLDSIFKFIICGTDTDIGKTLISSFFCRGLNSFYWKPIQSGIESQTDSQTVEKLAQVSKDNQGSLYLHKTCFSALGGRNR